MDPIQPTPPASTPPSLRTKLSGWIHKAMIYIAFVGSVLLFAQWFLNGAQGPVPPIPVIPELAPVPFAPPPPAPVFGWVSQPEEVEKVKNSLPVGERYFKDTPAGKAWHGENGTVLLSDAALKVMGAHLPARNQKQVGCCPSFASGTAVEYLQLNQIAGGDIKEFKEICTEAIYGGSRVQIGGGRVRGDGATAAWSGQWLKDYGALAREKIGIYDMTEYSETRARQWGVSGCPKPLEPEAKKSPVKGISFARSADEMARAIRQGYPIAIGSQVGFGNRGPFVRDKDGFLNRSGTWGHCQCVAGVRDDNRKGFLFVNSWGSDWVSGPTGGYDIPPGSYWVDWNTADEMAREGDCVVFSDAVGFPARTLDWFTKASPADPIRAGWGWESMPVVQPARPMNPMYQIVMDSYRRELREKELIRRTLLR